MNEAVNRDSATGSLEGYRVVDIGPRIASAFAAKHLAELGAEVVRVETPEPDLIRGTPPFVGEPNEECSALHLYLNASKRSLAFKYTAAKELLWRLLSVADAVINGHTPGESEALGLTADNLAALNSSAVFINVSTFGHTGPYRDYLGTDITVLALGGLMYMTGDGDREPLAPYGHQGEYQLGLNAAIAALVALFGRETTGIAQQADVAGLETCATMLENGIGLHLLDGFVRRRYGNRAYNETPSIDVYECKDGFVSMALPTEAQWASLCAVLGKSEWLDDATLKDWPARERRGEEIAAVIRDWCKERTKVEIFEIFQTHRMPLAPVNSLVDVLVDPQHAARQHFVTVSHPCAGEFQVPGLPFLSSVTSAKESSAPLRGEHTREVLQEWLGLSPQEVDQLRQSGAIYVAPGGTE
jgi:crotonobetainyl-CoA:carnitine CoA-transferase CaiB-like acyl-CoA transferase